MHKRNTSGLAEYRKKREKEINEKVDNAIRELVFNNKNVNFNSVHELSGVNKTTLYKKEDIKKRIEILRDKEVDEKLSAKDKTDKSKDIIIAAKDKKIKDLKNEIKELKEKISILQSELYERG